MLGAMLLEFDLQQNEIFDYLILMDGDGEDRPIEIKGLVEAIKKSKYFSSS